MSLMWVSPRLISYQSRHIKSTLWDYAEWPLPLSPQRTPLTADIATALLLSFILDPWLLGISLVCELSRTSKGIFAWRDLTLRYICGRFFFSRYLLYIILRAQISEDFLLLLAKDNWSLLLSLVCKSHDTQGSCLALGLFFHNTEVPFKSL